MRRHHPDPRMNIPISMKVYQQLLGAAINTCYEKEDWEIAAEAIDEWVRRHNPNAIPMPATAGYQWKSQFLPDGTLLRTVFGGKNYHCLVEGDRILYNGKSVSPSGFVNAVGGIRRNAWRCTWILFPDSKDWKLADTLQTRERPRRARKPVGAFQQHPATQPSVDSAPAAVPPVTGPLPAQEIPIAARTSDAPNLQHAIHDQTRRTNVSGEGHSRQQRTGNTLTPARCARGKDRRTNADERMTALLRKELLPLLYRMCAFDAMPPET